MANKLMKTKLLPISPRLIDQAQMFIFTNTTKTTVIFPMHSLGYEINKLTGELTKQPLHKMGLDPAEKFGKTVGLGSLPEDEQEIVSLLLRALYEPQERR